MNDDGAVIMALANIASDLTTMVRLVDAIELEQECLRIQGRDLGILNDLTTDIAELYLSDTRFDLGERVKPALKREVGSRGGVRDLELMALDHTASDVGQEPEGLDRGADICCKDRGPRIADFIFHDKTFFEARGTLRARRSFVNPIGGQSCALF